MQRQETRGAWIKFPKAWYEQLKVLDVSAVSKSDAKRLESLWTNVQNKIFLPYPKICDDPTRIEIDDCFSKILDLGELGLLREMLSREPMIAMK